MKRHRLMVVDDDPDTLASIRDIFLRAGFEVSTATTGREALAQLLDGGDVPSAIVLDSRMPVMTGEELAHIIRGYRRFANIPILFLTAFDTRIGGEADLLMRKPFRVDELVANVATLVEKRSAAS